MTMLSMCKKIVCFDLDDTLFKEIDFLKSGYRKVAELVEKRYGIDARTAYDQMMVWYQRGENAFANLNEKYGIENPVSDYLNVYRYHQPSLILSQDVKEVLAALKEADCDLGIITDGREITQKQKIEALGLAEWINPDLVLINEDKKYFKPNHWSFDRMMLKCYEKLPNSELEFYYVGDNTEKDFQAPNELGWTSICLEDDGRNIHKQSFEIRKEYLPQYKVKSLRDILTLI